MNANGKIDLFDDFTLDLARGCVRRGGESLHLRPQTYEVLKYLAENCGVLISKDKLIEEVWKGRAVTDGSLVKCIEELRETLGPAARQHIRNVRGRGYIFDPEISERSSQAIHSEQLEVMSVFVTDDESHARPTIYSQNRNRSRVLILLALGVVAAVAALVYVKNSSNESQIDSIAVLPFENATADPNADYISDGLTENLIEELAKLPGLKVIARSSSFTYSGRQVDVKETGRVLGVRALVTGRVERRGDTLVVSAEVVDTQDRSRVWGGHYIRQMADLQQLQDEIARSIAEKLNLRLSVAQERQLSKNANVNPQAYEFYLNGLFHFNQGDNDSLKKALEYFNQAVLVDPNFALGWSCVSRANGILGGNSLVNPKDTKVKAKAAARRALELDETLADGHFALGRIKQSEWDWAGAEQEYKRAIELSPSLVLAHSEYAQFLATMLRHNDALTEIKRAQELDPLSVTLKRRESWLLYLARRSNEAIQLLSETLAHSQPTAGTHRALGFMYEANGSPEQAVQQFRKAIALDGESTGNLCYLAGALAVAGRKTEALQIVDRLNRSKEYVSPTELAVVYARLKDKEAAITLLEKAYAEHDPQLQILNLDPFLDNIRSDPRFQDLLKRVGLPSRAQS